MSGFPSNHPASLPHFHLFNGSPWWIQLREQVPQSSAPNVPSGPWETAFRYSYPRRLPPPTHSSPPLALPSSFSHSSLSKDHLAGSGWLCSTDMQSACISKVPGTVQNTSHFTLLSPRQSDVIVMVLILPTRKGGFREITYSKAHI